MTWGMLDDAPKPKMVGTPGSISRAARRAMTLSGDMGMGSVSSPAPWGVPM